MNNDYNISELKPIKRRNRKQQINSDLRKRILDHLIKGYNITKIATLLGVSRGTIYKWMKKDQKLNEMVAFGKEIQAEIIANGRPSPAKIRNAMSNPYTWNALKQIGLVPKQTKILEGNPNPQLKIELKGVEDEVI